MYYLVYNFKNIEIFEIELIFNKATGALLVQLVLISDVSECDNKQNNSLLVLTKIQNRRNKKENKGFVFHKSLHNCGTNEISTTQRRLHSFAPNLWAVTNKSEKVISFSW